MRELSVSVSSLYATTAFLCSVFNNPVHPIVNLLISLSRVLYRLCCAYQCASVHAIVAGNREETVRGQLWFVTANFYGIESEYKNKLLLQTIWIIQLWLPSHLGKVSLQVPDSRHLRLTTPLSLCDCVQLKTTSEPTYVVLATYLMVPNGIGNMVPQSMSAEDKHLVPTSQA